MPRQQWIVAVSFLPCAMALAADGGAPGPTAPAPEARAALACRLLERLLERPQQVTVGQFSSHNKKGQNGDENWPLRTDEHGDDVIFDAAGPGCLRSMWGTNFDPAAAFKFYFDGEKSPRYTVPCISFYQGQHPQFPAPLVSYERRGYWGDRPFAGNSFVPIPYAKWLTITVKGKSRFFHCIYETYPFGTPVQTFTGTEDRAAILDAFGDGSREPCDAAGLAVHAAEAEGIAPGKSLLLFRAEKTAGTVRRIAIEADGSNALFREAQVRMRWDGHGRWDVVAPAGIFFGSAVEADDTRSLPLRVERLDGGRVRLRCYFPMPFRSQAEIVLANASRGPLGPVRAEIAVGPAVGAADDPLYFTTSYREGTTTYGRDWRLFDARGTGWFVGVVQSMLKEHYCEGNEHFTLDGAISPQINGTGTEDYYLACFWPNLDFDSPFACVAGDIMQKGGGQTGAYGVPSSYARFHLEAPIPFYAALDACIQHGGTSTIVSQYRSLAYCYLRSRPALVQTDCIDVGNPASERAHGYAATASTAPLRLRGRPEGQDCDIEIECTGRSHAGGEIAFTVAVDPANRGVRLRRRLDQGSAPQKAQVYVDGRDAGCWYHGYHNPFLRWYDADFDIHPDLTAGKGELRIRLAIESGEGPAAFTDFDYTISCFGD